MNRCLAIIACCCLVLTAGCGSRHAATTRTPSTPTAQVTALCDTIGRLMNLPMRPAAVATPPQFPTPAFGSPVAHCGPFGAGANSSASALVWPDVLGGLRLSVDTARTFGAEFERSGFHDAATEPVSAQGEIDWEGSYTGEITGGSQATARSGRAFVVFSSRAHLLAVVWF